MINPKDRAAAEAAQKFRTQADELRAKLLDPAVVMTKDEVETTVAGVSALETRAAQAAGFTPREEIDRQGGDDPLKRAGPESAEPEVHTIKSRCAALHANTLKHFGSIEQFVRVGAGRSQPRDDAQPAVLGGTGGLAP